MSTDDVINEFYRVCYMKRAPLYMVHRPSTPVEMIVGKNPTSDDWIEWRLVERSSTIVPEFDTFEEEIGYTLPPSFKRWHSRYYMLDGSLNIVRLPQIPMDDPFAPLRHEMFDLYLPEPLRQKGYLAFGDEGNDTGPICFHTTAIVEDHEYPIYVWEHEGDGSEQWLTLMFSNFQKLLECCIHLYGGTLAGYPPLPAGRKGFAVIDPDGAGKYFRAA